MRNKLLKVTTILTALLAGYTALGWKFYDMTIHFKRKPLLPGPQGNRKSVKPYHIRINHPRNGYEKEYEAGKSWCKAQPMKDCFIHSFDGLLLHAYYLPAKEAKRTVLLSHGYKGSGFGDFANIARFLHEQGCNLLFIDQRSHGLSSGESVTFGALEQIDVVDWMQYLSIQDNKNLPMYLYGQSMGAATVLMAGGHTLPPQTRGIIADCAYRSMRGQLEDIAENWYHIKRIPLLLHRVDLFCRLFSGFKIKDADVTKALEKNHLPVLFFHGEADSFVYSKNSLINYKACQGPKEMLLVPGARHLCSCYVAEKEYREMLLNFFAQYDA